MWKVNKKCDDMDNVYIHPMTFRTSVVALVRPTCAPRPYAPPPLMHDGQLTERRRWPSHGQPPARARANACSKPSLRLSVLTYPAPPPWGTSGTPARAKASAAAARGAAAGPRRPRAKRHRGSGPGSGAFLGFKPGMHTRGRAAGCVSRLAGSRPPGVHADPGPSTCGGYVF